MTIRSIAARGYERSGDDYERGRPGYPPEAVALLARELRIEAGREVLDLGAGTGKLTRALAATGARTVAVEPVAAMRRHLAALAGVRALDGVAEAIPLPAGSVDAVVCGTAFHWFDGPRALAEIMRVLRRDGGLGLIWNNPDDDVEWVAAAWGLIGAKRGAAPRNRDLSWRRAFATAPALGELRHRRFDHAQRLALDELLARVRSIAFVATLEDAERDELLARVREIAAPQLDDDGRLVLPYRTDVYWCRLVRE